MGVITGMSINIIRCSIYIYMYIHIWEGILYYGCRYWVVTDMFIAANLDVIKYLYKYNIVVDII